MSILRFEPFRDPFRDLDRLTNQMVSGMRTPSLMPMDAWRSGDTYHVELDLPGIDPSSVELTVERNSLTVQAQRQSRFSDDDQVLVAERPQGSFSRQLVLGEGLDNDQIQASYNNGVLALTIPLRQGASARRIEISKGHDQPSVIDMTAGERASESSST